MPVLLLVLGVVWLIAFMAAPGLGADWAWDVDNGLGFAAFAGLLYLALPGFRRRDLLIHEATGYAVLFVAVVHALWFLLADNVAIEYIKIDAPFYMWAGIIGLVLMAVLVGLARLPHRVTAHRSYAAFKYSHIVVSVLAIAMGAWHIIVSGFYLRTWYQVGALLALVLVVVFARPLGIGLRQFSIVKPGGFLLSSSVAALLFAAVRNATP